MKIYFYPNLKHEIKNPYVVYFRDELKKYTTIVNNQSNNSPAILDILKYLFSVDVYIFNWIENISYLRFGVIQTFLFLYIVIPILRIKNVKVVWVYHNFEPHHNSDPEHHKRNNYARIISKKMMIKSSLIIAHSKDAYKYLQKNTKTKIIFFHHPIKTFDDVFNIKKQINTDILIWGRIHRYKCIIEFVEYLKSNKIYKYNVDIIGECPDIEYDGKLRKICSENIHYENRQISFDELQFRIKQTRYIVFPYISNSISSSGALIDTLALGGTPIGPNKGAFKDLNEEGLCFIFNTFNDIIGLLENDKQINSSKKILFIKNNSWDAFIKIILDNIE